MLRKPDEDSLIDDQDLSASVIEWCSEYLLKQGPLEYFVHHNTLHSFEKFPFFEGLELAENLYQSSTRMSFSWFQEQREQGRISEIDIQQVMTRHFGQDFPFEKILMFNEDSPIEENIDRDLFLTKEGFAGSTDYKDYYQVKRFWDFCHDEIIKDEVRNFVIQAKAKFLSAYFDKGTSYWAMEERENGLENCFKNYLNFLPSNGFNRHLKDVYKDFEERGDFDKALLFFFEELDVPSVFFKNYLFSLLHHSKGWSALVFSIAENPDFNPTHINVKVKEYLMMVLTFELATFRYLSQKKVLKRVIYSPLINKNLSVKIYKYLYDSFLKEGHSDREAKVFFRRQKEALLKITEFNLFKIWQESYELNLVKRLLTTHMKCVVETPLDRPWLQVVTCIDDREESTRRYYEEYSKGIETFGYAGHFGLNMKYRSIKEAHFRALCPLGAPSNHYVFEEVLEGQEFSLKTSANVKKFLLHNAHFPLMGSLLTFLLGPFTLMLFLFETIAPKWVHESRKKLKRKMFPAVQTRLNFLDNPEDRELPGFSLEQLAQAGISLMKTTGLANQLAPLVFLCGHGSKSMNNPHGAAYNCGACAGGKGAPNARLMAQALNDKRIRKLIGEKGIQIPENTIFVGGYHCTSTDKILVFPEENMGLEKLKDLKEANDFVEKFDAKERMRKFENVSLNVSADEALLQAQNRSYDYSQPRPEYGHNTNAFCLVGPRIRNKGMFLDRRAFLVSYDELIDQEGDILKSLLGAVIPVCAGINLEYYFSYVDSERFGAGVKQAHNVTSLMGVMNGYRSDLRLGLPWQMVEIHEPSRIIFIIESSEEKFEKLLQQNKHVHDLVVNEWVLVYLNPREGVYLYCGPNGLESVDFLSEKNNLESKEKSAECYQGRRDLVPLNLLGVRR